MPADPDVWSLLARSLGGPEPQPPSDTPWLDLRRVLGPQPPTPQTAAPTPYQGQLPPAAFIQGMIQRGWSPAEAHAAAGNVNVESAFYPSAINPAGRDTGLVQWTGARKKALKTFAMQTGRDWTDPEAQMDYLHAERTGASERFGGGNERGAFNKAFRPAGSPAEMAQRFGRFVERPKKLSDSVRKRQAAATQLAQEHPSA